jgi:hypothetical protein
MLGLRPFFVVVLWAAAASGLANELTDYDSLRLVSAMREDERMLRAALTQKLRQTGLSGQDMQCLDRFDYPQVTDIVANEISARMTAAEVRDAISYFQSPSGRKLVRRELGIASDVPLTTAERADLEKFKQRPAGRKLFRDLILKNAAAMTEVMARLELHLEDCAFRRQSDLERGIPTESCRARPVASTDNVCLATYTAEGNDAKTRRASVEVNCRNAGRVLTSRIAVPDPEARVALRWSDDRELSILVDGKIKNASAAAGSSVRVRFAPRPTNEPPLDCVPQTRGRPSLAESLPLNSTVGAWRAFGSSGLCLMTARVLKKEVAGADGDMLLQFRRQSPAAAPFATTELAFIVQIYQQSEQPLLVDSGQQRLALVAQTPQQTHMLTGQAAELLLQDLRSRPLELTVRRAGAANYSIPIRRLDFDFAYVAFSECLATVETTGMLSSRQR